MKKVYASTRIVKNFLRLLSAISIDLSIIGIMILVTSMVTHFLVKIGLTTVDNVLFALWVSVVLYLGYAIYAIAYDISKGGVRYKEFIKQRRLNK